MRRVLSSLAVLACLSTGAQAADSTVAALTAASALTGAELVYCVQSAADRKCTAAQFNTYILTSGIGATHSAANIFGTTAYNVSQATGTDTDTASSGTIATTYVNRFGARTLASSSATTLTTVIGNRFEAPIAGSNVTFTNPGFGAVATTNVSGGSIMGFEATQSNTGYRNYAFVSSNNHFKLQRWTDGFGTPTSGIFHNDNSVGTDTFVFDTNAVVFLNIASDATHTDSTVCQDTTSHAFFSGSGTAGICLGTSSIRFKHDVAPLTAGLSEIMKLEPVSYYYNEGQGRDPNRLLYGFVAEQGSEAIPALAAKGSDGQINSFDYMGVVPVLVKAIQEQQAEINELKRKLNP